MPSPNPILVEKKNRITTITINRPEVRNAIDGPAARSLAEAFRTFDADSDSDVAVLCGNGGSFCAGADLKAVAENFKGPKAHRLDPEGEGPLGPTRFLLQKPVIAAVSGYAVAGGFELALWCDLRVAEKSAQFGVFCRRWGVPLIDGGTVRLPRLIGLSRALDLILTGRPVGAEEALSMGIANRVVPDGEARQAAEELAASLIRLPQRCLREDRLSAYEQFDLSLTQAISNEFQHGMKVIQSGETVQGAGRFAAGKGRGGSFDDI
ncbi:MAG TPA: crotonase/enoyl-CoA hydratase family protein [Deltaproteobacteria bacterium]|nr:crotonase/enoyl-CoA hydratase family protein [Deltaproteobacteria bacterium]